MKTNLIVMFVAAFACVIIFSSRTFAIIGDTPDQYEATYGKSSYPNQNDGRGTYHIGKVLICVDFSNGKAVKIDYSKWFAVGIQQELSSDDIALLLKASGGNKVWKLISDPNRVNKQWTTEDDTLIARMLGDNVLIVTTKERAESESVRFDTQIKAMSKPLTEQTNLTLNIDGEIYNNVRFGESTPATVKLFHSSGVTTISLSKLPPDLQQRFGYDTKKSTEYQNQLRQENIRQYKATLDLRKVDGVVVDFSNLNKLMDLNNDLDSASEAKRLENLKINPISSSYKFSELTDTDIYQRLGKVRMQLKPYWVRGKVQQVTKSGLLLECFTKRGWIQYPETDYALLNSEAVFLKNGDTSTVIEGSAVNVLAVPVDNYTFTTVLGANRTIRAFDCGVPIYAEVYHGKVVVLPVEDKHIIDLP